jgi:2'-5' RNA ligase
MATSTTLPPGFQELPDDFKPVAESAAPGLPPGFQALPDDFKPVGAKSGPLTPGNIDLVNQPRVKNADGSTSTVRSMSFGENGKEILIPTVAHDGSRVLSDDEAIAQYRKSGKHLGVFKTPEEATAFATQLHNDYAAGKYDRQASVPGMEKLGGVPPGVPTPQLKLQYSDYGKVPVSAMQPVQEPFETMPALEQIAQGGKKILTAGPTPTKSANVKQLLSGGSDVIEGAFQAAGPAIIPALVAAPLEVAGGLIGMHVASKGTEEISKSLGAAPETSRFLGNAVALAIAGGGIRYILGKGDAAIERHNETARNLLEQERSRGNSKDQIDEIFRGESHPVVIDGQPASVQYAGGAAWQVVNEQGKPIFGGKGRDVSEWLRVKGAVADSPIPAEPTPIVRQATDLRPLSDADLKAYANKLENEPLNDIGEFQAQKEAIRQEVARRVAEREGAPQQPPAPVEPQAAAPAAAPVAPPVDIQAPTAPPLPAGFEPVEPTKAPEQVFPSSPQASAESQPVPPQSAPAPSPAPAFPGIPVPEVEAAPAVAAKPPDGGAQPTPEVAGFTTAKGSTYVVNGDSTTRTKTLHQGHDPKDVGEKPPSSRTVYVDPKFATEVGMWNTLSSTRKRVILGQDGKVVLVSASDPASNRQGRDPIVNDSSYSTTPKVGLAPLELFNKTKEGHYSGNHPGNEITKIQLSDKSGQVEVPPANPGKEEVQPQSEAKDTAGVEGASPEKAAPPAKGDASASTPQRPAVDRSVAEVPALPEGSGERLPGQSDKPGVQLRPVDGNKDRASAAAERPSYASTQVDLPEEFAKTARAFGDTIPDAALTPDGRETDPHVTVRFGNNEADASRIEKALEGHGPITAKVGALSIFPNVDTEHGKADVLKLDIDSPDLRKLNALVGKAVPHPGETHPDYKPHLTIGYLKAGEGKKYAGKAVPGLSGKTITFDKVAFSPKEGEKAQIPLKASTPVEKAATPVEAPVRPKSTETATKSTQAAETKAPERAPEVEPSPTETKTQESEGKPAKSETKPLTATEHNARAASLRESAKRPAEPAVVPAPANPEPSPKDPAAIAKRIAELEAQLKAQGVPVRQAPKAPTQGQNIASALRKTAEGMQRQIDEKNTPSYANQNVTARRARHAAGKAGEAERLERIQKGLRALADLQESGEIPEVLKGVRSRSVFEAVMPRYDEQGKRVEARFYGASLTQSDVREILEKSKGMPGVGEGRKILERRQYSEIPHFSESEIPEIEKVMDAAVKRGYKDTWTRDRITGPKKLYAAGINEGNFKAAQDAIVALGVKKREPTKEEKIREAERDLIGSKIEGYFPTPKPLAARMVEEADIEPGMSVLEPSAGDGAIADAVAATGAKVTAIEPVDRLRKILELKGHAVAEDRDFLQHNPARDAELRDDLGVSQPKLDDYNPESSVEKVGNHWTYKTLQGNSGQHQFNTKHEAIEAAISHKDLKQKQQDDPTAYRDVSSVRARKHLALIKKYEDQGMSEMEAGAQARKDIPDETPGTYDRIVMNPPFERGQDMDHVRHAFDLLKPGGRMVAIMSEGSFSRSDRKATEFRDWLEAQGGENEKLPAGSFTGKDAQRQTGVSTRLVTLDKPAERQPVTVAPHYVKAAEESRAAREELHRQQEEEEVKTANVPPDIERRFSPSIEKLKKLGEEMTRVEENAVRYAQRYTPAYRQQYIDIAINSHLKAIRGQIEEANAGLAKFREFAPKNGVDAEAWLKAKGMPDPSVFAVRTPQEVEEDNAAAAKPPKTVDTSTPSSITRAEVEPTGKQAEVYTTAGRKVSVAFDVRESSDLTNSFDAGYPQEYQPRDTGRQGSRQRVEQRKGDMNPALMADSRLASDGAPIVLKDGAVITRNHGTQALKELYQQKSSKATAYKDWLAEHAAEFGVDPKAVEAMKSPVLVRVITDSIKPADLAEFAQEANMSSAARMSDAEMADMLARRMTGKLMDLFDPGDSGRANPEFVRELVKDLPVEEQSVFQDRDGKVSQTGARIIRNAIFAKAYPDPRALERMAESESPSLRNVTSGMLNAAPAVARFEEAVSRGDRFPVGIGREIADAAAVMDGLIRTGTPVAVWLDQGDMFGRDPVVESLVRVFSENRRSSKRIGEFLKEYTDGAESAGSPKQESMFGPPAAPEKADVIEAAYARVQERWKPQSDLFAQPETETELAGGRLDREQAPPAGPEEGPAGLQARRPVSGPSLFDEPAPEKRYVPPTPTHKLSGYNQADLLDESALAKAKAEQQSYEDRLLGDRLTAQMKSGMAARPAKLKPAETRDLFADDEPDQGGLFDGPAALESRPIPGFYSALERAIEAKMPAKASAEQVHAIVSNPQNGVKPDELKWVDLPSWLSQQKGAITKQEALEFVRQNQVKVEEVEKGGEAPERVAARERADELGKEWEVVNNRLRTPGPNTRADLDRLVEIEAEQRRNLKILNDLPPDNTKFGQYVLPGGKNYRELLLTLPSRRDALKWTDAEYREVQKLAAKMRGDFGQTPTDAERSRWEDLQSRQKNANSVDYKSSHWDEPNVLAHVRFDDRQGPGGEKILHVAEIQSDWHQEGRKKGYQSNDHAPVSPVQVIEDGDGQWNVRRPNHDLGNTDARVMHWSATGWAEQGRNFPTDDRGVSGRDYRVAFQNEARNFTTLGEALAWAKERVGQLNQTIADQQAGLRRGVPQAPFSKTWHELAFRRMLQYGAENGYDRLTWDTGETAADRFDISKQLSMVRSGMRRAVIFTPANGRR